MRRTCSRCPAYRGNRSYEDQQRCSDGEIVEMTRVAVNQRLVGFPDDLPLSAEETAALQALHRLLGEVGSAEGISYAEQAILQKRRRNLVKLLWAWGLYGEPAEEVGLIWYSTVRPTWRKRSIRTMPSSRATLKPWRNTASAASTSR